jgi:co-chaperonin GroES (HSP10)
MQTAVATSRKVLYHIKPRNGWVLVRKLTPEQEVTEGGIIVDRTTARTLKAEVVEISTASDLKPGDIVLINAMTLEMEDLEEMTGDKKLVMLRDEEIYARCEAINQ